MAEMDYGYALDELFITGDVYIFLGDGTTSVPIPDFTAIQALVNDGTPINGLIGLGDTKIDESITFEQDDATLDTKGTLQHRTLREQETAPAVQRWTINSAQPRSGLILKTYYGGGTEGDGTFDVPRSGNPTVLTVPSLLLFKDGTDVFPAYCPATTVRGNGTLDFSINEYATVPLAGTIGDPETGPRMRWYSDTFAAPIP